MSERKQLQSNSWPRGAFVLFLFWILFTSLASTQQVAVTRRIVNHPAPSYPKLARAMALAGVVKVDAVVTPNGTVKDLDIKGGHPVLAQAAANTIRQWKWEPATHESHEVIEIRFSPPE